MVWRLLVSFNERMRTFFRACVRVRKDQQREARKVASVAHKDRRISIPILAVVALLCFLVGVGASEALSSGTLLGRFQRTAASVNQTVAPSQGLPEFTALVNRLRPAVVNISSTRVVEARQSFADPYGPGDPFGL